MVVAPPEDHRTLGDLLAAAPDDAIALVVGEDARPVPYGDLRRAVAALAAELSTRGVRSGDRVGLVAPLTPATVVAVFAVTAVGAIVCPLNPALPPADFADVARHLDLTAALAPDQESLTAMGRDLPDLAGWLVAGPDGSVSVHLEGTAVVAATDTPGAAPTSSDDAFHMLTGGTTAAPKTVPWTHANVIASVAHVTATYALRPGDATVLVMPLFHGHGLVAGLLASLAAGAQVRLPSVGKFSASRFWDDMTGVGATWYTAVPTIHQILLARADKDYPADPPALRFIRSCSAPMPPAVLAQVAARFGAPVLEAYGTTETTHQAASNPAPEIGPHKPGSVGLATGLSIRVAGASGTAQPSGTVGEVWLQGETVTRGYLGNEAATSAAFVDGWFHTGDLGSLDDDGYLFLAGRIDDEINRGGEKISPMRVDRVLCQYPGVVEAVSFGIPDAKYGQVVASAIELKPGVSATGAELRAFCQGKLDAVEIPAKCYFPASLPRTAKGEGNRRALAGQAESGALGPGS